jgi:hypothetical protein
LSFNERISDTGLQNLPSSLTKLDIYYNQRITERGIRKLPPSLTRLVHAKTKPNC